MRKIFIPVLLVYITSLLFSINTVYGLDRFHNMTSYSGHEVGICNVIQDSQGNVITEFSRNVYVGEEIILPNGDHYRIVNTYENNATVKYLGKDSGYMRWVQYFKKHSVQTVAQKWKERPVGIYHTHTDESYKPTSGKSNEPFKGDIYQVGQQFANTLRDKGINVIYYKTPHDPHDNNAYVRSRRTAAGILKNNPVALFDIHRDGVPNAEEYRVNINGQQVAKVRLVVGKQNPRRSTNKDFAKRLMAQANQMYPGLIEDLYMGKHNYNQDLLSTAVLMEVGTHTSTLEGAKRGVTLFADVVPAVLGLTGGNGVGGTAVGQLNKHNNSAWVTAGWLVLVTLVGLGGFYFISNGNLEKAVEEVTKALQEIMSSPKVKRGKKEFATIAEAVKRNITSKVQQIMKQVSIYIRKIILKLNREAVAKPIKNKKRKSNNE